MTAAEVAALLGARRVRDGQWEGCCPGHDDRTASLSIGELDNGGVGLHCHADDGCELDHICGAAGIDPRELMPPAPTAKPRGPGRIVATYDYHDESGELLIQVCRFEHRDDLGRPVLGDDGKPIPKTFRQRRPDDGGWTWSTKGARRPLYRLPELLASADDEEVVYLVEGEKDVEALRGRGLVATCNPGGAGKGKWKNEHTAALRGRDVVIVPDNDTQGEAHARRVAGELAEVALRVRVLRLPGLPEKGDVSDWFARAGDRHELERLVGEIGEWQPEDVPEIPAPPPPTERDRPARIDVRTTTASAAPMRLADLWLELEATLDDGTPLVRHWRGDWYRWRPELGRYARIEAVEHRATLRRWLDGVDVLHRDPEGQLSASPLKVTRSVVGEVADALHVPELLVDAGDAPRWLPGGGGPPPDELLVAENGLFHLPTGRLIEPSPLFFAVNGLGTAYDADALEPREWLRFLAQLWPDDQESIDTLQEWIGYLLVADTSLQKILLLVGPKRGGKGTVARIIRALLGAHAVAGPTLGSLTETFGLEPLLDRLVAIISDARLSGRADQAQVVERLLGISGEDPTDVNRKHKPAVTTQLPARFMILTNELPRLADSSGAMSSRFVVLTLRQSWLGREDTGLQERLLGELPGILLWAIEGWRRLRGRGRFLQPASSQTEIEELERIGSPVSAFVADECECGVGDEFWATVDDLYVAWRRWCEHEGRQHPGTKAVFARDLLSAVPAIRQGRRDNHFGKRERGYYGLKVNPRSYDERGDPGPGQDDFPF